MNRPQAADQAAAFREKLEAKLEKERERHEATKRRLEEAQAGTCVSLNLTNIYHSKESRPGTFVLKRHRVNWCVRGCLEQ